MEEKCFKWEKINSFFTEKELNFLTGVPYMFVKALAIIGRVYAECKDKSGYTSAGHFVRVSDNFLEEDLKVVGLLHDIVEDGYITFNDLRRIGFPDYIIEALVILARDKKVYPNYEDYVTSVIDSNNILAIRVKYADMLDNSSVKRLELLEDNIKIRLANKYRKQLPRLEAKLARMKENKVLERINKNVGY